MQERIVSQRGVFRDLSLSPYEYKNSYGDSFKFPSAKKLEIYEREIAKEEVRLDRFFERNGLSNKLPIDVLYLIYQSAHQALYEKVIGVRNG